jgi:hypothetical protein
MGLPSSIILALVGVGIAVAAVLKFSGGAKRRSQSPEELTELDLDIGLGVPCPSCRSIATNSRGSFEKRQCVVCGLKFELKD